MPIYSSLSSSLPIKYRILKLDNVGLVFVKDIFVDFRSLKRVTFAPNLSFNFVYFLTLCKTGVKDNYKKR